MWYCVFMAKNSTCVLLVVVSVFAHTIEDGMNVVIVEPDQSVFMVFTKRTVVNVEAGDFANIQNGFQVAQSVTPTHNASTEDANGGVLRVHRTYYANMESSGIPA
jgi:hypothetical protein